MIPVLAALVAETKVAVPAVTKAAEVAPVAVALAGMVGFVGLAAPHAARLLLGPAHRALLPASALCGGFFLAAADGLCRWLLAPAVKFHEAVSSHFSPVDR